MCIQEALTQTNNAEHATLLSAQTSSMFAALASAHNRLLKSLSCREDKGVDSLTSNWGL